MNSLVIVLTFYAEFYLLFYRDFINILHCPFLTLPILRALFTEKTLTFCSDFVQ